MSTALPKMSRTVNGTGHTDPSEFCARAGLPYAPSVLGAGLAFGAWHGLSPNSLFLAALGAYWGHLYAQTRNVLVPVSMHAVWNAFTLGVGACVVSGG